MWDEVPRMPGSKNWNELCQLTTQLLFVTPYVSQIQYLVYRFITCFTHSSVYARYLLVNFIHGYLQRMRRWRRFETWKYDDTNFKLSLRPWIWSLNGLFNNLGEKKVYSCMEDSINSAHCTVVSEVSSFVGNPVYSCLWVY